MHKPLPSNEELETLGSTIDWRRIESLKQQFNRRLKDLGDVCNDDSLPPRRRATCRESRIPGVGAAIYNLISKRKNLPATTFVSAKFRQHSASAVKYPWFVDMLEA